MNRKSKQIFTHRGLVMGVIHVPALPGTPAYQGSVAAILDRVMEEQAIYSKAGIDALIIENMHDTPYLRRSVGPEITAMMSMLGRAVKTASGLPCGIQILAGANCDALAAAQAGGLDFIRAEGFVFAHVADEGTMNSDAGTLLRYRKKIEASDIAIFTDIKKKHSSHAITADVSLAETAAAAAFFGSDGLIITGAATGQAARVEDFVAARQQTQIPLMVGSGISIENVSDYLPHCEALIVGSWFKEGGHWANALSYERVANFMERVGQLRKVS